MLSAVEIATQRIMQTYSLMFSEEKAQDIRETVVSYIETLFSAGETDESRLAVCGLAYLREKEGRSDPVGEGFTGL